MDFGVTITHGVSPWQIFQQNERGTARIRISGKYRRIHLSAELPLSFTPVEHGAVTVKARVALESSGENIVPWTLCRVEDDGGWSVTFESVPAGGPYRIET